MIIYELVTKKKIVIRDSDITTSQNDRNVLVDENATEYALLHERKSLPIDVDVKAYFPTEYKYSLGVQSIIKNGAQEKLFFREMIKLAKKKNAVLCYLDGVESEVYYPPNFQLSLPNSDQKTDALLALSKLQVLLIIICALLFAGMLIKLASSFGEVTVDYFLTLILFSLATLHFIIHGVILSGNWHLLPAVLANKYQNLHWLSKKQMLMRTIFAMILPILIAYFLLQRSA